MIRKRRRRRWWGRWRVRSRTKKNPLPDSKETHPNAGKPNNFNPQTQRWWSPNPQNGALHACIVFVFCAVFGRTPPAPFSEPCSSAAPPLTVYHGPLALCLPHLHNIISYLFLFAFWANIVNFNWILTLVGPCQLPVSLAQQQVRLALRYDLSWRLKATDKLPRLGRKCQDFGTFVPLPLLPFFLSSFTCTPCAHVGRPLIVTCTHTQLQLSLLWPLL